MATIQTISSANFTWTGKIGVAEDSDLTGVLNTDQAIRDGFYVTSERTQATKFFKFDLAKRDADGDVTVWIYKGDEIEIHILND